MQMEWIGLEKWITHCKHTGIPSRPLWVRLHIILYLEKGHLLNKIEDKAMWVLKKLNLNWSDTYNLRLDQLNDLDKF